MNKSDILTLYDYNYWATSRILHAAEGLTPEEYVTPMPGISHGTLRATLVHALAAEHIWRQRCLEGVSPTSLLSEDELPTLEALRNKWTEEERKMRAGLDALTDEALPEPIVYGTTGGRNLSQPLGQLLTHVVNHGTQHRAEAAVILSAFGRSPGDVDLVKFLRERTPEQ